MLTLIGHVRVRLKRALSSVPSAPVASLPSDFNLSDFEFAESAAHSLNVLWNDAQARYKRQLLDVLETITPRDTDVKSTIAEIIKCDDATLTRLASMPATVAWQRTFASTAIGRVLYSVDGFPCKTILGRRLRRRRRAGTKARRCSMNAQQGGAIETLILSAPA
jgi:uncharacterized protein